ncbi:hypothetical protein Hanom_Chr04g00348011 [Helianthus anomalus]
MNITFIAISCCLNQNETTTVLETKLELEQILNHLLETRRTTHRHHGAAAAAVRIHCHRHRHRRRWRHTPFVVSLSFVPVSLSSPLSLSLRLVAARYFTRRHQLWWPAVIVDTWGLCGLVCRSTRRPVVVAGAEIIGGGSACRRNRRQQWLQLPVRREGEGESNRV